MFIGREIIILGRETNKAGEVELHGRAQKSGRNI